MCEAESKAGLLKHVQVNCIKKSFAVCSERWWMMRCQTRDGSMINLLWVEPHELTCRLAWLKVLCFHVCCSNSTTESLTELTLVTILSSLMFLSEVAALGLSWDTACAYIRLLTLSKWFFSVSHAIVWGKLLLHNNQFFIFQSFGFELDSLQLPLLACSQDA